MRSETAKVKTKLRLGHILSSLNLFLNYKPLSTPSPFLMDHSRQRHHSRLLPTTIQDLFSPVPAVTVPQSLESLANTWLPKSLSYDGEGGELGALEERAQEEENASFEDEGAFYYSTSEFSDASPSFQLN